MKLNLSLVIILLCVLASPVLTCGQAPVITPKPSPIKLYLDANGQYTISLRDVATITGYTQYQIIPTQLDCASTGSQTIRVKATNGVFATPTNPTAVTFGGPWNIAIDGAGNIYFSDFGNNKIKKITPYGDVTTLAGSGNVACNDGPGAAASFSYPIGVAADRNGNIYVADARCNVIKKITPDGNVSLFAGNGVAGYRDGLGGAAQFYTPQGLVIDNAGNLYVADVTNNVIRKITPSGLVSTFAGSTIGDQDGPVLSAMFNNPSQLAIDAAGNIYVSDTNNQKVKVITVAGQVITIAGTGAPGAQNGPAMQATFNSPYGIAVDAQGNVFVSERFNNDIRKITPAAMVTTFAGNTNNGTDGGDADGLGTAASFHDPTGLAFDANGNLFVGDRYNHKIKKITPDGNVVNFAGSGRTGDINGNIGGAPAHGDESYKDIPVTVYSTPAISPTFNNIKVDPDANCAGVLDNYIPRAQVTDNCGNATPYNITQSPAPGTPVTAAGVDVTLTVTDASGGTGSRTFRVNLSGKPAITPKAGPVIFRLDATGHYSVQLSDVASVTTCNGSAPVVTLSPQVFDCSLTGNQTVTVQAAAADDPTLVASVQVPVVIQSSPAITSDVGDKTVNAYGTCVPVLPDYTQTATATDLCLPSTYTFTQNPVPGTPLTVGQPMSVTLNVTDATGGQDSKTFNVTAVNATSQMVSFAKTDFNIPQGGKVQLMPAIAADIVSYSWSPETGLSDPAALQPYASPQFTTTYTLHVISAGQCDAEAIVTVNVAKDILIPNGFTPNGDGVNDTWQINYLNYYPAATVDVYNRYGQAVFHSVGYSKPWDGTSNGTGLPVGVYYYIINLNNGQPKLTGHITIIK